VNHQDSTVALPLLLINLLYSATNESLL